MYSKSGLTDFSKKLSRLRQAAKIFVIIIHVVTFKINTPEVDSIT